MYPQNIALFGLIFYLDFSPFVAKPSGAMARRRLGDNGYNSRLKRKEKTTFNFKAETHNVASNFILSFAVEFHAVYDVC